MLGIRTTSNLLELPVIQNGTCLLPETYLKKLVQLANEKFTLNRARTDAFQKSFQSMFGNALLENQVFWSCVFEKKEKVPSMLRRYGQSTTTCVRQSSCVYLFGGMGENEEGRTCRLNDVIQMPLKNTCVWKGNVEPLRLSVTGTVPAPRMHHTAIISPNEQNMIVFGGRAGPLKPFNDVHVLHFESKVWSMVATAGTSPCPRWHHAATLGKTI